MDSAPSRAAADSAPPPPTEALPPKLTYDVLKLQNAKTSAAIIQLLEQEASFVAFAASEANDIIKRDNEDGEKLQAGIQISIDKGVIPPMMTPPTYLSIDVIGKTPDQICDIIVKDMGKAATEGGVVVLCGLSGTGKGTTVSKLQERMPTCVTWSNGNIFRSLTLLAVTWCELEEGLEGFDAEKALSPANLADFMKMMSFGKFNGKWDIQVKGLGLDYLVSEVSNTLLKTPKVGKHIPTVAERTQGEVIGFAASATERMGKDGFVVLLEGREQTVDYVPSPLRYTLTMSDTTVLGQRRAAQRLGAAVLGGIPKPEAEAAVEEPTEGIISETLTAKLREMAQEAGC